MSLDVIPHSWVMSFFIWQGFEACLGLVVL